MVCPNGIKREHSHFVGVCTICGTEYDIDFEPPAMCHDNDDNWDLRIEECQP